MGKPRPLKRPKAWRFKNVWRMAVWPSAVRISLVKYRQLAGNSLPQVDSLKARLNWRALSSRAKFLCSCLTAVPSSRPAERRSRRAQGRSRPAVAFGLRRAPALPGRAEHGARIKRVGRLHRRSSSARSRVLSPAPPRRCGQACWRARSPARCGATASWRLRSRI